MPNHCLNVLTIHGEWAQVQAFVDRAEGPDPQFAPSALERQLERDTALPLPLEHLQFHNFVPVPPEVLAAGFGAAGHDWCLEHWGTKWSPYRISRLASEGGAHVVYLFQTAWSPPIRWLQQVAAAWANLRFELRYVEEGSGIQGTIRYQYGCCSSSSDGDW